jgi:hypothetical protein
VLSPDGRTGGSTLPAGSKTTLKTTKMEENRRKLIDRLDEIKAELELNSTRDYLVVPDKLFDKRITLQVERAKIIHTLNKEK